MHSNNLKARTSRKRSLVLLVGGMLLTAPGCDGGVISVPAVAGASALGGGALYLVGQCFEYKSQQIEYQMKQKEWERLNRARR